MKVKHLLVQSDNGNDYLYSPVNKRLLFLPPKLNDSLKGLTLANSDDDTYYKEKIKFLKEHDYFETLEMSKRDAQMTADHIQYSFSNCPQVIFEVTEDCNLSCTYCTYGELYNDFDPRTGETLSFIKAKGLIDYFIECWCSNLNKSWNRPVVFGFYGGEPLLNMNFIKQVVEYVSAIQNCTSGFRCTFTITTNGLLLNKYFHFLMKNEFDIAVSLDGSKSHNEYRKLKNGNSSYDLVSKSLLSIKDNYPEYYKRNVKILSVLHSKNAVDDVYQYIKEVFDKVPEISDLSPKGIKPEKQAAFNKIYKNYFDDISEETSSVIIKQEIYGDFKETTRFLHRYTKYVKKNLCDVFEKANTEKSFCTGTCIPFSKKIFLSSKGLLFPCEQIGQLNALGHVDDSGNVILPFKDISDSFNELFANYIHLCSKCCNYKDCPQCIFFLDHEASPKVCESFHGQEDFKRRIKASIDYIEHNRELYNNLMNETIIR